MLLQMLCSIFSLHMHLVSGSRVLTCRRHAVRVDVLTLAQCWTGLLTANTAFQYSEVLEHANTSFWLTVGVCPYRQRFYRS